MPLRQLQVHMPMARVEELDAYLDENDLVTLWRGKDEPGWGIMAILVVDAFKTDALVHDLVGKFGEEEHFRLVFSEVTAVYPAPDREEEEEEEAGEDAGANPSAEPPEEKRRHAARISIEELEERLQADADCSSTFLLTAVISAFVAALGLMRDNTAVVIGAMVIAPLLGPNMALALGTTLGKWALVRRAMLTNGAGFTLALALALVMGVVLHVDPSTPEIASRTSVSFSDVGLALASGVAGALAVTTGVPAALVGVMVAVALVPPLVTAGLMMGSGEPRLAGAALLLVAINVIAVNLAAVATFAAKGIQPRDYWETRSASTMTRVALAIWITLLLVLVALVWLARDGGVAL